MVALSCATIVVFPFTNLNKDPEQEYLSDGITEDLITDLSQVSNLVVRSRTSSYLYKDKKVNIKKVASQIDMAGSTCRLRKREHAHWSWLKMRLPWIVLHRMHIGR